VFLYSTTKEDQEKLKKEKAACHWCQLARFSTHARYPVIITNQYDDATFPEDFEFVENSVLCNGIQRADKEVRAGCECENDTDCEYAGCGCLQDLDPKTDKRGNQLKISAYLSKGPKKGCLREDMLESRDPIYECHDSCKCSDKCSNRVVERGRKIPLEIFRTKDRGWGMSRKRSQLPVSC
jgi:histone-lysine N-methyltransferase SUV39H